MLSLAGLALWAALGMMQDKPTASPQGPPPPGATISRLAFEGLQNVAEGYVRSLLKSEPGKPFDADQVEEDVTRLLRSGKFDQVRADPVIIDGELVLTFRMVERPVVAAVDIVGNRKFKTKDLEAEIDLAPGGPISEFAIKQAIANIERKYKEAGFYYAKVDINRPRLEQERVVEFDIREGPRVRVRKIRFDGNAAFPARKLSDLLETKTYIWVFRTGDFDPDRAERDAATLANFYKDNGYLDARVGYKLDFVSQTDLTVIFTIDEGVRYAIRDIIFKGNTVYSTDDLQALMKLKPGDFYMAETLQQDLRAITERYGSNGYIYADIRSDWVYAATEAQIDLTVSIVEREQYRFGRIVIRGNSNTKDKVIRRELRFFPEELYDTVAVRRAENRLVETRLFNTATIQPVGDQPASRDALVRVEEADSTLILFGVGVNSNSGLVGSVTLENRNFDLFDVPRNATELFKGRAFRGAGQIFRLQIEPGTELTRGRIDFREPYLLDQDVGLGTSLYLFQRNRIEWDERRLGFNFSFDRRFREGLLKNFAAEVAFRFESINISDVDWLDPEQIRDVRGDNWLTSIRGTIVRDTTDSRFMPSLGNRTSVSYEQAGVFGGDSNFGKLVADTAQHFTLLTDSSDRKHVVSIGATAGQIFGDAPVFERFFGGGIGSIRGFDFRGVSPRAGTIVRNKRVGGDFQLLTNAEYSFPLIEKTVRGVAFLDMGTIEENTEITGWRAAVGLGLRLYLKPFGSIPLAFDFAVPLAKEDGDDTQVFSFSFGTTF